METLSLDSPRDFHHRRNKESPHHFHKHLLTVTGNGGHIYGQGHMYGQGHVYGQGHMYGHGRKHGHGHGHGNGERHTRRQNGEGEDLVSGGKQGEGEGIGGRRGRDGCHGCDKRHGGRHGRWGSERSPVLQVPEETAGQKEVLPAVKKTAGEKEESLTAVKVAEDATEPADCRHGCHRGHGHGGRHGHHGFHGGKDKSFSERDGCHGKRKFGKEHKRDKSHKRDKRDALLDVVLSTDAYALLMDAPGVAIDDVSVTREDAVLVIRTERKSPKEDETEGERVLVRERIFGIRVRQVALPKDAVLEAATCEITEGVLTVTVPRRSQDAEGGNRTEEGVRTEEGIRNEEPRGESGVDFEMADEGGAGKAA